MSEATTDNDNGARLATAQALSKELGIDMSPELFVATDRFLIQLYLLGHIVTPVVLGPIYGYGIGIGKDAS